MKLILAVLALFSLAAGPDARASGVMETSPGGTSYARLYMPDAEKVSIQVAWPANWAMRENENQAVPFIGADLILAGGAQGHPAGEVVETFADLKAEGRLSVTVDYVFGSLTAPKEHLAEAVGIANAHLQKPALDEDWLARLRAGFAASMAEAAAIPATKGFNAIRWAVLGDSSVRRMLSMDPLDQITAVTRAETVRWHRETFFRNTAHIVIAGPLDAKEAGEAIDALLAGLPDGVAPAEARPQGNFAPRRILLHVPDAQASTLTFMGSLPPTRDGGVFEDVILASALGSGDQSVLFEAIRTELRASYAFSAGIDAYSRNLRLLFMSGEVETAKLSEAEATVRKAYEDFLKTGPSGDIDERKAPFIANAEAIRKDSVAASFTGLIALLDKEDPGVTLKLESVLADVTAASTRARLSSAFPRPDSLVVLAVSPDRNALPGACVISEPSQAASCP